MPTKPTHDVIIIGAGIAGLTTATMLRDSGYNVLLLEKSNRVGGMIQTVEDNGFICECGPNTFRADRALTLLAIKVGLDDHLISNLGSNTKKFVVSRGKLLEISQNPLRLLGSGILSWRGKLRLLWEPFAKGIAADNDESLAEFVRRRLGNEVLDNLVNPLVSGIIAGDPEQLSAAATFPKLVSMEKRYGSLFKALRAKDRKRSSDKNLYSFDDGMEVLPKTLAEKLDGHIYRSFSVDQITSESQKFVIQGRQDRYPCQFSAPVVITATPAHVTSNLLSGMIPEITTPMGAISYAPIAVVHTGFRQTDFPSQYAGFGFLVPRKENIRLLGSVFSSHIFYDRAPEGSVLLTNMYGGASDPGILDLNDNQILQLVQSDLNTILGISARPQMVRITRHTRAIPQYNVGHQNRVGHIKSLLATRPGLFCTGNYLTGFSLPDTITNAKQVATEAAEYLTAHRLV